MGNYLLALDPGSKNTGVAVVDPASLKVLAHGMNPYTLRIMTPGMWKQLQEFERFLKALQAKGCEYAIAERFQTRGIKGLSAELVGVMLGVTSSVFRGKVRYVIASQWKNAYARAGLNLKEFYLEMRPITPHQVDAALIGLWMACRLRKQPLLDRERLKGLLLAADQPTKEQLREIRKTLAAKPPKKKRRAKGA